MLTTQDKKDIKNLVSDTLTEFAKELMTPSFELVYKKLDGHEKRLGIIEKDIKDIKEDLGEVKSCVESTDRRLDLVIEKVTDHDKQISKLKVAFAS